MFDMVLKAAAKLAKDLLFPIFEEMDRNQQFRVQYFLRKISVKLCSSVS